METAVLTKPKWLSRTHIFIATALYAAILIDVTNADKPRPQSTASSVSGEKPRPSDVKPRLSFSPSVIKACETPVVTLECSIRSGNSLEARIAARRDGNKQRNKMEASLNTQISAIKIFKMGEMKGTGEDGWKVFAELGYSDIPSGFARDNPKVKVTGKVGVSANDSYLRVVWDTADLDTFGVYSCDVVTSQRGSGSEIISSEVLSLDPAQSDCDGDSKTIMSLLEELKAQRQRDEEWRRTVDARLVKISQAMILLERFARGNSYRLNRMILTVKNLTTTTTSTTPTTTATTARTFATGAGGRDATKDFIFLGIAGGKPTATLPPPGVTEAGEREPIKSKMRKERKQRNKQRLPERVG